MARAVMADGGTVVVGLVGLCALLMIVMSLVVIFMGLPGGGLLCAAGMIHRLHESYSTWQERQAEEAREELSEQVSHADYLAQSWGDRQCGLGEKAFVDAS